MRYILFSVALLVLLQLVSGCAPIRPERVTPFGDYANWYLEEEVEYTIFASKDRITVPAGFVTDYASIPRSLCLFLPKQGRHSRPAIIHDYLYWRGEEASTREQADQIMYLAMIEQGVSPDTRNRIYKALRVFGQSAWDANAKERAAKPPIPRVIPRPLLEELKVARAREKERRAREAPGAVDPDVILVGNKTWADFRTEIKAYYARHPEEREPEGSVDVEWEDVETEYRARSSSEAAWWQFWRWF